MFMIYTTENCLWCKKAKDLLTEQNFEYITVVLDTQEKINEFKQKTGHKTVPQVYLDTTEGEYIGGYDDLEKFLLDMITHYKQKIMMNPVGGYATAETLTGKPGTITVREHGNNEITVTEENRVESYNITIPDKKEMKDITPK